MPRLVITGDGTWLVGKCRDCDWADVAMQEAWLIRQFTEHWAIHHA